MLVRCQTARGLDRPFGMTDTGYLANIIKHSYQEGMACAIHPLPSLIHTSAQPLCAGPEMSLDITSIENSPLPGLECAYSYLCFAQRPQK
jgi:hypothetical protein